MNNPIIQRELVGMLRTRKALAVMVVLALALSLIVIVRWPTSGRVDLQGTQARQVLRVFGYGMTAALILLAPIFPATSIVRERVQGTLALLLNSPIKPSSIVVGKMVGALGFVLLLLVLSLPAGAACYAMGGVYLGDLAKMYGVLALLAISYATLGLLVSTYASTMDSALRVTYGLVLVLALFTLGPSAMFGGATDAASLAEEARKAPLVGAALASVVTLLFGLLDSVGISLPALIEWLRCVSPLPAIMELLGDTDVAGGGAMATRGAAGRFILIASVLSVVFAGWTAVRLSQRILDRKRDEGKITDERSGKVQAYRRIMFLWFFDPQRRSGLIGPLVNPVMVKEQRCRRFGRGNWMMRLVLGCLVISLLLMLATATQAEKQAEQLARLGGVMVLLQMALIVLITPSLASGVISSEIESRSWQLLQMTPLSAGRIIRGKLLSVAVILVLVLLATLPGYAVLLAIEPAQLPVVWRVILSLALTALMCLLVSAAVSSCFRNTAAATAVSYAIVVGLSVGTLLFWLGEGAPFGHRIVETVLKVNPLAASLNIMNTPGFTQQQYALLPDAWWAIGGISVLALIVLGVRTWRLTRPS